MPLNKQRLSGNAAASRIARVILPLLILGGLNHIVSAASLGDGLFSTEQAARGEEEYRARCSSCHAADLRGNSNSPGLRGIGFLFVWEGRTVGELFTKMRSTMPTDNPASLSNQEYLDILAFLLAQNDYPAGTSDLANAAGELDTVVISAP